MFLLISIKEHYIRYRVHAQYVQIQSLILMNFIQRDSMRSFKSYIDYLQILRTKFVEQHKKSEYSEQNRLFQWRNLKKTVINRVVYASN